jgi:hypothetical protein
MAVSLEPPLLLQDWLGMSALLGKLWLKQGLPRVEDGEAALARTAWLQWKKPWLNQKKSLSQSREVAEVGG